MKKHDVAKLKKYLSKKTGDTIDQFVTTEDATAAAENSDY